MTAPSSPSNGNEGCRCLNKTAELASLTERACTTPSGEPGIILTLDNGACAPLHYGSSVCQPHDLVYDPNCDVSLATNSNFPHYCFQSWCYVDADACVRDTDNAVYRSSYFPVESGVDMFYSYDACNSTGNSWMEFVERRALGGIHIKASVPSYLEPMIFKRDGEGNIIDEPGEEYYDNSVPYEGAYMNYIKEIMRIAKGDITNVTYTYKSRSSTLKHPSSHYTAAVQDIENGLVDMSIGPFWITGERLKLAAFTVPLIYDRTVLVIPKPGSKNSLSYQTSKVLAPFTAGLWGVVILVIVCTSLLSVWFANGSATKRVLRRRTKQQPRFSRQQFGIYARLSLDSILEKGLFFFSGGVEQDGGSSLPYKLLMFGFGFFILISVSAYVANLAAFLTRSVPDYVATMEGAVKSNLKICGHPALAGELTSKWPDARFVFSESEGEFYGVLEDYKAGKCDVLAVGREDTMIDLELLNLFCDEGLVYTNSLVMENPIAFPVRPDLASGLSYWILQGDKYHGVSLKNSVDRYTAENKFQPKCNVELSAQVSERNDYAQIMPTNMFFPIIFWLGFAITAAILQIVHLWQVKKGRKSSALIGRVSTLNLFRNIDRDFVSSKEDDDLNIKLPRITTMLKQQTLQTREGSSQDSSTNNGDDGLIRRSRVNFHNDCADRGGSESPQDRFEENAGNSCNDEFLAVGSSESASFDCDIASPVAEEELNLRIRQLLYTPSVVDFLDCCQEMKNLKMKQPYTQSCCTST
mmetsp:Transcript_1544/g.3190  ORF Transcript_1544/g.3190 Transcript_1544/m.3190 type:complete len:753 (+) Transcript_1544:97-2355(+)